MVCLTRATALFAALIALLFWGANPAVLAQDAGQSTPQPVEVGIRAPVDGEALQGVVTILGATQAAGFMAAEISFAYQTDPTNTWFSIQQSRQPAGLTSTGEPSALASWDTSTITDGVYRLRLQVFLQDGQVVETVVSGLRVRNYTPVETSAPALAGPTLTPPAGQPAAAASITAPADFQPAAPDAQRQMPAATNPAQITREDIGSSAARGVLIVFGALLLSMLYLGLRALLRR